MQIVFHKIFSDSKKHYVEQKLQASYQNLLPANAALSDQDFDSLANGVIENLSDKPLPIAEASDFYELTPKQTVEIEARKRCAVMTLAREFPLLEGEIIEEDFFSYLVEPFGDAPADTPVLRRKTNYSEHYYLFSHLRLHNGNLELLPQATLDQAVHAPLGAVANSAATDIAKQLGSGLVSGIGGKIGALIFDSIFPPGVPSYFDQVYDEIKKIVGQALTANTIDEINGRINGTQAWVKNSYTPRKEATNPSTSRRDLFNDVTPFVNLLYTEAVQTLMLPRYAKEGFSVFMIAAGVHLALLQEQALVDPDHPNPEESSFAISVKLNAQLYYDHAVKTYNDLIADRKGKVKLQYNPFVDCMGNSCVTKPRYFWQDDVTGESSGLYEGSKDGPSAQQSAQAALDAHVNSVVDQLISTLGNPLDTTEQWRQLTANPIPKI